MRPKGVCHPGLAYEKRSPTATATVVIHHKALGEAPTLASFPSLAAGEEVGSVCEGGDDVCEDDSTFDGRYERGAPAFETVRVDTLDGLGLPDRPVDFLLLDVEGYDPKVIAGGPKTVRAARFLEFEYHFRGAWAHDTLQRHVDDLATHGFDCYLQGAHSVLWRLSNGCFHPNFELKAWSNVACVKRDDLAWHAFLEDHAAT